MDSFEVDPLDDPKAKEAATAFMMHINTQRKEKCGTKPQYTGTPKLIYVEHGYVTDEKSQYRLEIILGLSRFMLIQIM